MNIHPDTCSNEHPNGYSKQMRFLSALLALIMSLSLLSGCGKKKKDTASTSITTISADAKAKVTDEKVKEAEEQSTTSEIQSTTTTKATTTKKTTAAPAKVKVPSGTSSGVSQTPSATGNVASAKELASVDPRSAAAGAYDTTVEVAEASYGSLNPADYTYVAYSDYTTHIYNCWNKFQSVDNVIIEKDHFNEYLNTVTVPLKSSFGEINCHGFDATYATNPSDPSHIYMSVKWIFYINATQYNACKAKASSLVNSVSGSTVEKIRAIHDILGKNNTYKENVDGAYNCLINNTSDCDGYSAAFKICMDLMGVPCKAFATDTHIFNCVQVGGKWYVVDVTYDDQTNAGFVFAKFFLVGSSMYSNYTVLKNLLSSTDYPCSHKLYVTDDATFCTQFLGVPAGTPYTLNDDGTITVYNQRISIVSKQT